MSNSQTNQHYQTINNIAVINLDNAPVNALSKKVRVALIDGVTAANQDDQIQAIVISSELRLFSSGADITEFSARHEDLTPHLPEVLHLIEQSNKPVIAAVTGNAFGGGLELAMACHYRVSFNNNMVGLPEVKLGLLPGAGGTQRLPRLAGIPTALQVITSGNPTKVQKLPGLFDELVDSPADILGAVQGLVAKLAEDDFPVRRACDIVISQDSYPAEIFEQTQALLSKTAANYPAPFKCLQAVRNSVEMDFDAGLKAEQALFMECMATPESAAQRHLFFAERQAAHLPKEIASTPVRDIQSVAVIGAGTMGGGIAMNFINVGIPVKLVDRDMAAIEKGIGIIRKNYQSAIKKGRLTEEKVEQIVSLITPVVEYSDLAECDLVIEAVFEDMNVKKQVFKQLDEHCKAGAILASNTSTLDIDEIATATSRPEDVIGMHFFSPANVMQLLEVVRCEKTSFDVINTVMKLAKKIKKTAVLVKVCFGFVGNRMIEVYARESNRLVLEGAKPEQVDRVIYEFGMAMGPFVMGDMAGLDIGYFIRNSRRETIAHDPSYCVIADRLVEAKRVGLKAGIGIYKYEAGSRTPIPDPEVLEIARAEAEKLGIEQREVSDQEILERCMLPLINEGMQILEEGIAQRASDIDIIYIFGYGFPPFRGGPMHYAEHLGLANVRDRLAHYQKELGEYGDMWFQPTPLLNKLADEKMTLADYAQGTK